MQRFRRLIGTLSIVAMLAVVLAIPASATPKNQDGEHKVTICHVTNSSSNPWVIIDVDFAAFDGDGKNDHYHHVSKDGRMDVEPTNGTCPTVEGTSTPTPNPPTNT